MTRARMTILAVLLALVAAACGSGDGAGATAAPTTTATTTAAATAAPTTTMAPTTTPAPLFGTEDAKDVAFAYFEAYNEGDVDAVYALLEPDAKFNGKFGPLTRAAWDQLTVWNAAQGTVLSTPSCLLAEELVDVSVRLVCSYTNSGADAQAVDGPAVPIRLTLVITPEGIVDWKRDFGTPDFNEVGIPFSEWMTANHPEIADDVEFGNWTSVEQAEQNGILTKQYAAEWRVFLDANGCAYNDGC